VKILGVDLETQGLEKETKITEIGASLWDYTDKKWTKISGFSKLCYEPEYGPQPELIVDLTGITDEMLKKDGRPRLEIINEFLIPLVTQADVIIAHNKKFEMDVLGATFKELGVKIDGPKKEWICTMSEVDYPAKYKCHKLSHMAYDHSILVPPEKLHRAEQDVDLMFMLVQKYDFDEVLAYARQPSVVLRALCAAPFNDGGIESGIAKSLGFSWEKPRGSYDLNFPKMWVACVKRPKVQKIIDAVNASARPFQIKEIKQL
jgi:hypothetical protein